MTTPERLHALIAAARAELAAAAQAEHERDVAILAGDLDRFAELPDEIDLALDRAGLLDDGQAGELLL